MVVVVGQPFRFAAATDVGALVELVQSAYRGEQSRRGWTTEADLLDGQRTDPEAVLAALTMQDSLVLVAEDEGQLVGCCHLEAQGEGLSHFGMFCVRPDRQQRGWGKAILAEAERLARENWGATTMTMMVIAQRDDLIAWYERRGFRRTGERRPFPYGDERFGIPRRPDLEFVVLSKPL
ncbi:MAG: GNAT family N-acetyltransferase [Acidimicrobiales bacterium]